MALIARNGVWLTRATAPVPDGSLVQSVVGSTWPLSSDGLVQAIASGEFRMTAGSNMQLYSALSNVQLGAQGSSNTLTVTSNAVEIRGQLRIRGTVDAISTSDLSVQDKVVRVSVPSPIAPATTAPQLSELDLDASGLALAPGAYEKSMLWRVGGQQGTALVLPSTENAYSEAFALPRWDAVGGALRMTIPSRCNAAMAAAGGTVGYGFTINAREELELIKYWTDASTGAEKAQRVWCVGGGAASVSPIDAGEDALLPTSVNPYA
jgi:hypothetical protein